MHWSKGVSLWSEQTTEQRLSLQNMTCEVKTATRASHPAFLHPSDELMRQEVTPMRHHFLSQKNILPEITTSSSFEVNLGTAVVEHALGILSRG